MAAKELRQGTLTLIALMAGFAPGAHAAAPPPPPRHNVVLILTDDQDFRSMHVMPQTRKLIGARGTTFTRSFISFPLCCPSRATLYTGQYAHNHGVQWNTAPTGGYYKLKQKELLPIWLHRAGYRTIHIGKFLNQVDTKNPREVPRGWDDYEGGVDPSTYDYYGMTLNFNGHLKTYGRRPQDYSTDVYAGLAEKAIDRAKKAGRPFFMSLAPNAPHTVAVKSKAEIEGTPAVPPPRYAHVFDNTPLPRYPNFNEADMSDKPAWMQGLYPLLNAADIASLTAHYRGRMGALMGVDDLVARVVAKLKAERIYGRTDIIFTSDNGWILGEHRLRDTMTETGAPSGVKFFPYEGSSRVPLMAAGPDFPSGRTVPGPVVNADLAPTIEQIAGARPRLLQDGRSLVPVARHPSLVATRGILLETFTNPRGAPPYTSIRTERYRLDVQRDGTYTALYDLKRDPWELQSVHGDPRYAVIEQRLERALAKLRNCKGRGCEISVGTLPEPGT